jgi:hypothetical protein
MSKTIVGLIAEKQSNEAVSAVKKALAKKLVQSISEAKSQVARDTYGRIVEFYGADEQPDYMNDTDNAYAIFFANALKKFGVSGPEDFKDDVTKQRFFDYVDHNWRAQDTVQTPISNATQQSNMERGTQTQLPDPAAPPQAPTAPAQGPTPTTAQGNDPSLATMSPAGPSINKTAPLDQSGQDPTLNNVQNSQAFGGSGDQYGSAGNPQGMSHNDACPYCKGSGKAACPTCGRAHGLDNQQQQGQGGVQNGPGFDNLDQDPDLEIGPEGGDEMGGGMGDDEGEQPLADDDDGAMADNGEFGGDDQQMGGDDQMGGQAPVPGQEEETDDPFDDEDAYSIDASDFDNAGGQGGGDEEDGDEMGGDEGDVDEDGNPIGGDGDEDGMDDQDFGGEDDDQGGFGGGDDSQQLPGNGGDDDEDPDLEIGDGDNDSDQDDDENFGGDDDSDGDDEDDSDEDEDDDNEQNKVPVMGEALKHQSWSRKERKKEGKRKQREDGKKMAKIAEDFGFGLDDAEDTVFMAEAVMQAGVDPALNKIITYVQDQLNRIKKMRNTMLMQLRRQRAVLKKDPALGPEEKMEAMKQLATMAKDNRKFFKTQAKLVKAIFTGHLNGETGDDMGGGDDQDMGQGQDMDQDMNQDPNQMGGDDMQPQGGKKGFPPQGDEEGGDDEQGFDPDNDGDNDADPDQDTDQDFAGGDDEGGDDQDFGGGDDSGDEDVDDEEAEPVVAPKKGGFSPKFQAAPKKKGMEENEKFGQAQRMPTFAELKRQKFGNAGMHKAFVPQAKPVKEDELLEYGNTAAIEGKIKMLHMQIASKGDPGGKRRAALNKLSDELKGRK